MCTERQPKVSTERLTAQAATLCSRDTAKHRTDQDSPALKPISSLRRADKSPDQR